MSRLGTQELAAIGFTYPVVFIVMSLAIGIGMGATSAISRAIGNQNSHQIKRLTTDSLFLAFVLSSSLPRWDSSRSVRCSV